MHVTTRPKLRWTHGLFLLASMTPSAALAQTAHPTSPSAQADPGSASRTVQPPTALPPGYPPPPPGYMYVPAQPAPAAPQSAPPPPAGATPPAYAPAPPGYRYVPLESLKRADAERPYELPYDEDAPIPRGYRLVEEPRYGLVAGGWVLSGVTYGLSAMIAVSADFRNSSGFLLVPFLGPWLVMGRRDYGDCSNGSSTDEGARCVLDTFVVMGLLLDGAMQAGGGAMLLTGYLYERKKLVRNDYTLSFAPRSFGTGYGLAAFGTF